MEATLIIEIFLAAVFLGKAVQGILPILNGLMFGLMICCIGSTLYDDYTEKKFKDTLNEEDWSDFI